MRTGNQKGAILGWVVVLLMVITLMTGAALSASFGYYNHVVQRSRRQQAAYTARSVAEVIAASLSQEPESGNLSMLLQEYPGTVIEIEGLDEAMGTCTAEADYDEDGNLSVTVTASAGGSSHSVTAGFRPIGGDWPDAESEDGYIKWELAEFRTGEEHEQNP